MSSADAAVEPKRERGRVRVEAILDAAATLFSERGFAATTMTDVAARSHTAIGSLYRFFPTKAALAEALAGRYTAAVGRRFDAMVADAAGSSPARLADAFVDLMLDRGRERAVVVLLEGVIDADRRRAALRARFRDGIVAVLGAARPDRKLSRAEPAGVVVLQMLKAVSRLNDEGAADAPTLAELRRALALFLADVLDAPA